MLSRGVIVTFGQAEALKAASRTAKDFHMRIVHYSGLVGVTTVTGEANSCPKVFRDCNSDVKA